MNSIEERKTITLEQRERLMSFLTKNIHDVREKIYFTEEVAIKAVDEMFSSITKKQ